MQQRHWFPAAMVLVAISSSACGSAAVENDDVGYRVLAFVSPVGAGSVVFVPDRPTYAAGEHVLLRALPSSGHHFVRYSGGVAATTAETSIVIDGDLELTVAFAEGDDASDDPGNGATLEVVNDLPGGKDAAGNWARLNTLVRVTVDDTELLTDGDSSCEPTWIAVGSSRVFEVGEVAPDYELTVQTGAWEYDPFFSGCWDLYVTAVNDCGGSCCALKQVQTRISGHSGKKTLRLSSLLPAKTWEGSPLCEPEN